MILEIIMDQKKLVDLYWKKNEGRVRFVYHLGGESGFFSEYNNMILAILYCLQHKIQFSIYSQDANFKYDSGWSDYFVPFCDEYGSYMHSLFNRRTNDRFKSPILNKIDAGLTTLFRKCNADILTTFDLWNAIRSQDASMIYDFPELGLTGNLRSICRKLIEMTWVYNEETNIEVEKYKQQISLPDNYVGFHIRGGDKFIEADIQKIDVYIRKAETLSDIRTVFVLTDDYSMIEDLKSKYLEWTFYTLCDPKERGYFHESFKQESSRVKKSRYIKLFASVDLLAESSLFIGTFSSNPGMYLGMRMDPDKAYSVDLPEWRVW